jgi:PEP-CTERM motif-containing protein
MSLQKIAIRFLIGGIISAFISSGAMAITATTFTVNPGAIGACPTASPCSFDAMFKGIQYNATAALGGPGFIETGSASISNFAFPLESNLLLPGVTGLGVNYTLREDFSGSGTFSGSLSNGAVTFTTFTFTLIAHPLIGPNAGLDLTIGSGTLVPGQGGATTFLGGNPPGTPNLGSFDVIANFTTSGSFAGFLSGTAFGGGNSALAEFSGNNNTLTVTGPTTIALGGGGDERFAPAAVPEPASLLLLASGLMGVWAYRRRNTA